MAQRQIDLNQTDLDRYQNFLENHKEYQFLLLPCYEDFKSEIFTEIHRLLNKNSTNILASDNATTKDVIAAVKVLIEIKVKEESIKKFSSLEPISYNYQNLSQMMNAFISAYDTLNNYKDLIPYYIKYQVIDYYSLLGALHFIGHVIMNKKLTPCYPTEKIKNLEDILNIIKSALESKLPEKNKKANIEHIKRTQDEKFEKIKEAFIKINKNMEMDIENSEQRKVGKLEIKEFVFYSHTAMHCLAEAYLSIMQSIPQYENNAMLKAFYRDLNNYIIVIANKELLPTNHEIKKGLIDLLYRYQPSIVEVYGQRTFDKVLNIIANICFSVATFGVGNLIKYAATGHGFFRTEAQAEYDALTKQIGKDLSPAKSIK